MDVLENNKKMHLLLVPIDQMEIRVLIGANCKIPDPHAISVELNQSTAICKIQIIVTITTGLLWIFLHAIFG